MRSIAERVFAIIIMMGLSCALADVVRAHHQRKTLDTSGTPIPNLTHGQLRVIARYRPAILSLADKQVSPEFTARTLQNYVNLQYTYCMWGLIPGSITDENSPFNECSHAYLAASKALLDELSHVATVKHEANALAEKINLEMLAENSVLQICSNSMQPFNTAQIIMPERQDMRINPVAVLLALVSAVTTTLLFALLRRTGRKAATRHNQEKFIAL